MALTILTHLLTPDLGPGAAGMLARARAVAGSDDPVAWLDALVAHGLLTPSRRAAVLSAFMTGAAETSVGEIPGLPRLSPPTVSSVPAGRATLAEPGDPASPAFVFGDILGRGGMGSVYRATDRVLGRDVAFKLLADQSSPQVRQRFLREARITAQLDHPNIVPIHVLEAPPQGGHLGYAMKLVEGRTLAQLIRESTAIHKAGGQVGDAHTQTTLLEHFLKVCDAIAFAHSRGVLHRDLKPSNIMIGRFNEVYVMDWGVARRTGQPDDTEGSSLSEPPRPRVAGETSADEPALTRVGQIVGTPRYMSPEQARGQNDTLDARTDQYALGVILFEIVSLRRAVPGETGQAALASAAEGKKVALEHIVPGRSIAPELAAIVTRATAREQEDRYPDVAALADDVRRHLRGEAVLARPDPPLQRVLRWMNRHRQATLVVVLAAIALTSTVGGIAVYRETRAEQARAVADRRAPWPSSLPGSAGRD